jgi:hypothetical protein
MRNETVHPKNMGDKGYVTPKHSFLDSDPNLEPLISRWEINKFENC